MPSNKPDRRQPRPLSDTAAPSPRLRRALAGDIAFVVGLERRADYRPLINSTPAAEHLAALENPDVRYLILEANGARAGYAILAGLTSRNHSVELRRIAVERPGEGLGRKFCALLLAEVFDRLNAHRLHLDLFEDNERAERLYLSLGFRSEGVLREAERRGRTYRSLKVMALLEHEYRRRPKDRG